VREASLVRENGNAAFSLASGRIVVTDDGSPAVYTLTVPRAIQRLRVHVDTALVFERAGERVVGAVTRENTGAYVLPLAATP
jgi:hypothetical protein